MSKVAAANSTSCEYVYVFKPVKPLPAIDLSKSLRGELLPPKVNDFIHRYLTQYHQPLLLANVTAFCLISFVAVVNARTGQFLSLVSIFLWMPLGFGAFSTLRYDVVRLLMRTFDFWFFSFVTSMTAAMVSAYFRDLRFLRMVIDWVGFHHIVCIDAHVRGVRQFAFMTVVGIPPVLFILVWIMLGHVDGCTSYSILNYENAHHSFHLSGVDVIGNGLMTLALFITKIAVRKRRALRSSQNSSSIQCVIYRCALQLVQVHYTAVGANIKSQAVKTVARRRAAAGTDTARKVMLRETNVIQKMRFVTTSQTFNAGHTIFPLRGLDKAPLSTRSLVLLYFFGALGLLLSFAVLLGSFVGTDRSVLRAQGWTALLSSVAFVVPFAGLYHRQLFKLLVGSFDFIFYALQITAANVCVCILCKWEICRCLVVLTWELWFLWALTLDALTPIVRDKLRFRVRFAAPVVALLLLGHIVIMNRIFFVGDAELRDVILYEGVVWDHPLIVRAMPFYFSRVVTLLLWCPRLIWRLIMASKTKVAIIRGVVCYNNYSIPKEKRQHSGKKRGRSSQRERTYRRDRIAPAATSTKRGPGFSALGALNP